MEVAEKIFANAINVLLNDSRSYQVIRLIGAPYNNNLDKWDETNHQGIGNFDREEKCKRGRGHKILEFNTAGGRFFLLQSAGNSLSSQVKSGRSSEWKVSR